MLDEGILIHSYGSQIVYCGSNASTFMEASYFYLFVLPLGIFVFFLTAVAFYYARREELARRNWRKLMSAYAKKQLKQKEDMDADVRCEHLSFGHLSGYPMGAGTGDSKLVSHPERE
jgi:hypothetical protein